MTPRARIAADPRVRVRRAQRPADLEGADLVILPGSKSTMADLGWLRAQGLGHAIGAAAAAGRQILGVCGGYQMLGRVLRDPDHVESSIDETPGLGLLPVETTFARDKTVVRVEATGATTSWLFGGVSGTFEAYAIHAGHTRAAEMSQPTWATRPVFRLVSREGRSVADVDGAVGAGGNVEGTYLHGVFANALVRRCLLARLAERKGVAADPRWGETPAGDRYDRLAAIVGGAIDVSAIAKLVGFSYPRSAS